MLKNGLRPSNSHMWLEGECTGFLSMHPIVPQDFTLANQGSRAHLYLQLKMENKTGDIDIPDDVRETADKAYEVLQDYKDREYVVRTEWAVNVKHLGIQGTIDAVAQKGDEIHIFDYKSGFIDVEPDCTQLAVYACMVSMSLWKRLPVVAHILQGGKDKVHIFEKEALANVEKKIEYYTQQVTERKYQFNVGEHCKYCPVATHCTTANEAIEEGEAILNDLSLADHFKLKKGRHLKVLIDNLEKSCLELAREGVSIPGFKLGNKQGKRKIVDPKALEEFLSDQPEAEVYDKKLKSMSKLAKTFDIDAFLEFQEGSLYLKEIT